MKHIEKLAAERYPNSTDDFQHGYASGYISGANADKWVSVDAPPEVGQSVLCLTKYGEYHVAKFEIVFKKEFVVSCICITDDVLFWQPLPKPPQQ